LLKFDHLAETIHRKTTTGGTAPAAAGMSALRIDRRPRSHYNVSLFNDLIYLDQTFLAVRSKFSSNKI